MTNVTIVIPVYNSKGFLELTIDSLFKSTDYPFKIILVESESTDGSDKICDEYAKRENIKVIHTKREGTTKANNIGIKSAGTDDVLLTQTDVIFPRIYKRDWLKEMNELGENAKAGIITCYGGGGVSGPDYLDGFNWVGTWCMYIPRTTINKVGILDEDFSPGAGDDIDYSYKVSMANLQIGMINYWVDHHRLLEEHKYEIEYYGKYFHTHAKLFKKKWQLN